MIMKIISGSNNFKLRIIILILLNIILINCNESVIHNPNKKEEEKLKGHQISAYPNNYQSPISQQELNKNNFSFPLLSKSLMELDPTKNISKNQFMTTIKQTAYNISKGELEQIFVFVDSNHNDKLDYMKWDKFVALFILPFEACNASKTKEEKAPTYLLTVDQFKSCFDSDPKSKFIKYRRRDVIKGIYKTMMNTISTRGDDKINFYEYLFIKKAMFAWEKCHNHHTFMAESHFHCALKLAVPNKILMKINIKKIFQLGLKYQYNDSSMIALDFMAFLKISHYTSIFTAFNLPNNHIVIERSQFLKAIKEDRLPSNFEESEVESFYELTNTSNINKKSTINFESFIFFIHMHTLFNHYSIDKPMLLTKTELLNLLDDSLTPIKIVLAIDRSFAGFNEKQYLEASLVLQRTRINESNFFSFLQKSGQDSSESTHHVHLNKTIHNSYYDIDKYKSKSNREIFFGVFSDRDNSVMTKNNFYRAFQIANLFIELCDTSLNGKDKRPIIPHISSSLIIKNLPAAYETVIPPISHSQRRNSIMYKVFPKEVNIDMLTFLISENLPYKIFELTGKFSRTVDETIIKVILKSFGMSEIPDTVLDIAKTGFDKLRRRLFDTKKLAENVLITLAVASEHKRNTNQIQNHNLKLNGDLSRLYPTSKRRFMSSPRVK